MLMKIHTYAQVRRMNTASKSPKVWSYYQASLSLREVKCKNYKICSKVENQADMQHTVFSIEPCTDPRKHRRCYIFTSSQHRAVNTWSINPTYGLLSTKKKASITTFIASQRKNADLRLHSCPWAAPTLVNNTKEPSKTSGHLTLTAARS